jgi:hypothetical protein
MRKQHRREHSSGIASLVDGSLQQPPNPPPGSTVLLMASQSGNPDRGNLALAAGLRGRLRDSSRSATVFGVPDHLGHRLALLD